MGSLRMRLCKRQYPAGPLGHAIESTRVSADLKMHRLIQCDVKEARRGRKKAIDHKTGRISGGREWEKRTYLRQTRPIRTVCLRMEALMVNSYLYHYILPPPTKARIVSEIACERRGSKGVQARIIQLKRCCGDLVYACFQTQLGHMADAVKR